jgi:parvulin-like peptidyl-prolyl isomerase
MSPRKKEKTKSNPRIRLAKEEKKNKLIVIGFIITAVLILGMIGYAILYTTVLKNNIPVAIVDGQKIDNEYYKARVRLERNKKINHIYQIYEQSQFFADDPNAADVYQQQLQQIASMLNNVELIGEMVLNDVIDSEIFAMQGEEMGIEISQSEIDDLVQNLFNYFPDGTPTPKPQPTAFATPTLSKTQEAILGIKPMQNIEDESDVGEETIIDPTAEPTATTTAPTQTPGPTATPYTEEMFQEVFNQYIGDLEAKKVSETYLRKYIYHSLMKQKVYEAVIADVPLEQEQIWARHILVPTKDEAIIVVLRLEEEAWDDVVADVSLDTSNKEIGGDLGWFTDQDIRPLSQSDYEYQQKIYFDEWFAGIKENIDIKINDVWKDIVPDDPTLQ